jgi:hypothetical protein
VLGATGVVGRELLSKPTVDQNGRDWRWIVPPSALVLAQRLVSGSSFLRGLKEALGDLAKLIQDEHMRLLYVAQYLLLYHSLVDLRWIKNAIP